MKLPFLLNSVSSCNNLKEIESVFNKLLKVLPSLDGNVTSHCLNILSKKEINHPKHNWNKIGDILTEKSGKTLGSNTILSKYEVKDVCIILNSFAKVDHLSLRLIEAATDIITKQIRNVHTNDICNVIHSLGKLNQLNPLSKILNRLFKTKINEEYKIEDIFKIIETCNEQDFSMILRVFLLNSERLKLDGVTKNLLKSISNKYDNLSDQTLAILANSLANYGRDENHTLDIIAPIITSRLRRGCFTPQCMAQIANAYAKLNKRDGDLFKAISDRVLEDITPFSSRSLSNILNGFSRCDIFDKRLFVASVPQLERKVDSMTPQCLGNVINSYSKFVNEFDPQLLVSFYNSLIIAILNLASFYSFIGQNYANILNGVSKLYVIINSPSNVKPCKIDEGKPATLKMYELFAKFTTPITKSFDDLNHLDVLLITNSMARCRFVNDELLSGLLVKLKNFKDKYNIIELTNIANTLSILYKSIKDGTYVNIINEEPGWTDGSGTMRGEVTSGELYLDSTAEERIKEQVLGYYLHYINYVFENINRFKNVRPLDIKLLFNSLGRCNISKQEYCDVLVDKYFSLNRISSSDLAPIVNHYVKWRLPMPAKLQEHMENNPVGDKLHKKPTPVNTNYVNTSNLGNEVIGSL